MPGVRGGSREENANVGRQRHPEHGGRTGFAQAFSESPENEDSIDAPSVLEDALEKFLELEEILTDAEVRDFKFPKIVVIGDQSAGKSTVLELLSGISLPKGSSIATRCPINIRLKRREAARIQLEYEDKNGKKKKEDKSLNRRNVYRYISTAQDEMLPEGKKIIKKEITLKVEGPQLPSFSITDLPGLNYSDKSMGSEIKELIREFIAEENTLIIIVHSCANEIETTEATELAQDADSEYDRTMCVLTKPDMLNSKVSQQNLLGLVSNKKKDFQLKKGFIVIKGPTPDSERADTQKYIDEEEKFFENHKCFKILLDSKQAGTKALVEKVSDLMREIARKNMPKLWSQIQQRYKNAVEEVKQYTSQIRNEDSKRHELSKIMRDINKELKELSLEETSCNDCEGYHIHCSCQKVFSQFSRDIEKAIEFQDSLKKEIADEYKEHRGPEPRGFTRYPIYKKKVLQKMQEVQQLSINVLDEVSQIVEEALSRVLEKHADIFNLLPEFMKLSMEIFDSQKMAGKKYLDTFFKMEEKLYVSDYNWDSVQVKVAEVHDEAVKCMEMAKKSSESTHDVQHERSNKYGGFVKLMLDVARNAMVKYDPTNGILANFAVDYVSDLINSAESTKQTSSESNENTSRNMVIEMGQSEYLPEVIQTVATYQRYIHHTCSSMTDTVPKIVEFHLVTSLLEELEMAYMNNAPKLVSCMMDDPLLEQKRKEAEATRDTWQKIVERFNRFSL